MKTAIVLPVYGCWDYVRKTLKSLSETTVSEMYSLFLIVNPNSIDDKKLSKEFGELFPAKEFLEKCYQDFFEDDDVNVHITYNDVNIGVSRSWNLGIKNAIRSENGVKEYDSFIILNSDVELSDNCVQNLRSAISTNCLLNPVLSEGDMSDIDLSSLKSKFKQSSQNHLKKSKGICGPCFMITRPVIDRFGIFDERFRYLWFEDVDFLFKLRFCGIQQVQVTGSHVHHYGQKSSKDLDHIDDHKMMNKKRFEQKWCVALNGTFHSSTSPDLEQLREGSGYVVG